MATIHLHFLGNGLIYRWFLFLLKKVSTLEIYLLLNAPGHPSVNTGGSGSLYILYLQLPTVYLAVAQGK